MKRPKTAYLSLGSNLKNKLKNLEQAVLTLGEKLGEVKSISSVYESKAWGFQGGDFYNLCLQIETHYSAEELLLKTQALERDLGRNRSKKSGYQDRCIDIDMLLYENHSVESENLTLPHPRMLDRKFVLLPLAEIAKTLFFPGSTKTINDCLKECPDLHEVTVIPEKINLKKP